MPRSSVVTGCGVGAWQRWASQVARELAVCSSTGPKVSAISLGVRREFFCFFDGLSAAGQRAVVSEYAQPNPSPLVFAEMGEDMVDKSQRVDFVPQTPWLGGTGVADHALEAVGDFPCVME